MSMKILIIPNYKKERTSEALEKTLNILKAHNAEFVTIDLNDKNTVCGIESDADIVLYIGGDGTFIRSAALAHHLDVPIIGINTGEVGYLSKIGIDEIEQKLPLLIDGEYKVKNVDVLCIEHENENICPIINDVVFSAVNLVDTFTVINDDDVVIENRASAVSVSTCIGSTGLNRSAGGAVVLPGTDAVCITPICPQSGERNSVVCSSKDRFTVKSNGSMNIYIDGELAFSSENEVSVHCAEKPLKVIK